MNNTHVIWYVIIIFLFYCQIYTYFYKVFYFKLQ